MRSASFAEGAERVGARVGKEGHREEDAQFKVTITMSIFYTTSIYSVSNTTY